MQVEHMDPVTQRGKAQQIAARARAAIVGGGSAEVLLPTKVPIGDVAQLNPDFFFGTAYPLLIIRDEQEVADHAQGTKVGG
jgi:hypothetical protein